MQPNIHLQFLRQTLLPIPGVTERPCYGTPGFYTGKKMFARMKEDGKTLVIQSFEREKWMDKDPEIFFITDHYLNYDYVLVDLEKVEQADLMSLLLTAYRNQATAKLIREFESNLKII
jgi:hypothetical protein